LTFIPKDKTFQKAESSKRLTNVHDFKTNQEGKAFLFPMSAIDNSFLIQSSKGILKFGHEDEAALRVVIEYLTTMEGYFWKQIRGLGLSYGYNIQLVIDEGTISFSLSKSSNLPKAVELSYQIIKDFSNGTNKFDELKLQAARSGVIFSIVNREETMRKTGVQSIMNLYRELPYNSNRLLLGSLEKVSISDCERVLEKYLKNLFDPKLSNTVITTNPSKSEEIKTLLKDQLQIEIVPDLNKLFGIEN